ncbi:MAG: hypothetical protein HY273_05750, partial [Gammaproteobacteria bacterium]|nr:hypothetical protein [Gammaproteobacteria bacterium]
ANITGGASKAFSYDSLGNMLTKTGVGTYTYGSATVRPHAVTKVTGTINGVVAPAYAYDNNGNLTSGAGRTLTYTSFNLPKSVTLGTVSQSYYYDPEHVRFAMTEGTANKTVYLNPRWDAGTHFEKETKGTIDEYKHFIYAGGKPVAMYVVKRDNTAKINSTYTRYLHTDHLGSVDVITKEDGAVAERLGYDAWGKRRNAIGTDSTTQLTSNITHHGYTGHEMADSVGLVNMNGRWYDPTLGRMMQADPTVSMPENLQSYNRYSYVMNNPLCYTDPTGYRPFWSKRKIAAITRDLLKDIANSKIYLGGKTYRVGGVLTLVALTSPTFGGAYAWSTGDAETVRKANEVAAVIVLSIWAGDWASGAVAAAGYTATAAALFVAESAAIGYTTSYAISRIYGASEDLSFFAGLNMTAEKDGAMNSWWGTAWIRQFFNNVSKVHDYGNSWAYDIMGNWISHGPWADTGFNIFSGLTMLPAASYTVAAYYVSPIGTVLSTDEQLNDWSVSP